MSLPQWYPPADHAVQPRAAGGGTFDHVEKLVLHTTETSGWPGYPDFAPHLTYNPWTHAWRQHVPLTRSSTTLVDASSSKVRENRDYCIQVEIVAYCDPSLARSHGHYINDIDDEAVRDLAALATWLNEHGGMKLAMISGWLPYPKSAGNTVNRLSGPEFDAFQGILGHEHVSTNVHGDPGAPPWLSKLLSYAKGATTTPAEEPGMESRFVDDVYINYASGQALKPGDNEIALSATSKTLVIGTNKGVDVVATLDIRDAKGRSYAGRVVFNPDYPTDPEAQATSTEPQFLLVDAPESFFRIVSYKEGTTTVPSSSRRPTSGDQVTFKGSIGADKTAGRQPRLRLIVNVPPGVQGLTVKSVQVSGWKM